MVYLIAFHLKARKDRVYKFSEFFMYSWNWGKEKPIIRKGKFFASFSFLFLIDI